MLSLIYKSTEFVGEIIHSYLARRMPKITLSRKFLISFGGHNTRFTYVMGLSANRKAPMAIDMYKETAHLKKDFKRGGMKLHRTGLG